MKKNNTQARLFQGLGLVLSLSVLSCTTANEPTSGAISGTSRESGIPEESKFAPRQIEFLDRGLVAVPATKGVLVSWRKFNEDADNLRFDLYRNGQKITKSAIANKTNFLDVQGAAGASYELRQANQVLATTKAWDQSYLSIAITPPADDVTPDGQTYSYTANDASVGDVDGDGQYEIFVKWDP